MGTLPIPRTKRFSITKFIYTTDSGEQFIRTQRVDKNVNGLPFFPLPSCFQIVTINSKDKIWGDPSNLRKTVIKYNEPANLTGIAQITMYVPQRPTNGTSQCLKEILDLVTNQFSNNNISNCVDYFGETRFTLEKPNRIN